MKRAFVLLAAVVIIFSGLLLAEANSSATAARKQSGAPDSGAGLLKQQIVSKERQGLDALKTGDLTIFANLTADDAVFVDDHGPAGKAQVLQNTAQFRLTDYTMDNVKFVEVSNNSGVISYELNEKGTSHGNVFSAHVYVSSVWAERAGKWVCLFSQETAAK
jgi:ketosteroid isomerase-like protein